MRTRYLSGIAICSLVASAVHMSCEAFEAFGKTIAWSSVSFDYLGAPATKSSKKENNYETKILESHL